MVTKPIHELVYTDFEAPARALCLLRDQDPDYIKYPPVANSRPAPQLWKTTAEELLDSMRRVYAMNQYIGWPKSAVSPTIDIFDTPGGKQLVESKEAEKRTRVVNEIETIDKEFRFICEAIEQEIGSEVCEELRKTPKQNQAEATATFAASVQVVGEPLAVSGDVRMTTDQLVEQISSNIDELDSALKEADDVLNKPEMLTSSKEHRRILARLVKASKNAQ